MLVDEKEIKCFTTEQSFDREFIKMIQQTKHELNRTIGDLPDDAAATMKKFLKGEEISSKECKMMCRRLTDPKICQLTYLLILAGEARGQRGYMTSVTVELLEQLHPEVIKDLNDAIVEKILAAVVYNNSNLYFNKTVSRFIDIVPYLMKWNNDFLPYLKPANMAAFKKLIDLYVKAYSKHQASKDAEPIITLVNQLADVYLAIKIIKKSDDPYHDSNLREFKQKILTYKNTKIELREASWQEPVVVLHEAQSGSVSTVTTVLPDLPTDSPPLVESFKKPLTASTLPFSFFETRPRPVAVEEAIKRRKLNEPVEEIQDKTDENSDTESDNELYQF